MDINRPHDTFFKQLMSDPAILRDFLKLVLPKDVLTNLDLSSLEIIDTEKSDRKYKKYYLDISAQCKLGDKDGELYLIFEHKSYSDKLTLVQILNYMAVVFEQDIVSGKNPRPILPIVFYHGETEFSLPTRFGDYFEVSEDLKKYLLDFKVFLFDTCAYDNEDLLKFTENMYLAAGLLLLKNIFKDLKELKPVLKQILKVRIDNVEYLLNYIVMAKEIEEEEFEQVLKEIGGEFMPTLAQKWLEQGKKQGLQIGLEQGKKQGWLEGKKQGLLEGKKQGWLEGFTHAQEIVLDLLEIKFSSVPPRLEKVIRQIFDHDVLKRLHRIILDVKDLDEFEQQMQKIVKNKNNRNL